MTSVYTMFSLDVWSKVLLSNSIIIFLMPITFRAIWGQNVGENKGEIEEYVGEICSFVYI